MTRAKHSFKTTSYFKSVYLSGDTGASLAASNSEIVLPLTVDGQTIGVLDIDSTEYERFSEEDEIGLKTLVSRPSDVLSRIDFENASLDSMISNG